MKRIIALLLALASVISISACSFKQLTPEEKASKRAAKESEYYAESSKREANIVKTKEELLKEIGKTQKGKKIVTKTYYSSDGTELFREYVFNKNGFADYIKKYYFYPESSYYIIKDQGSKGNDKLIDHDDDNRLLVYKYSYKAAGDPETTYDDVMKHLKDFNATIIE